MEPEEIDMALQHANHLYLGMTRDFGEYLAHDTWPKEWKGEPALALRWALCVFGNRWSTWRITAKRLMALLN